MVGFPTSALAFDVTDLANKFFDGSQPFQAERIFIPLLLVVDILIAAMLGHVKAGRLAIIISMLAMVVYVVVAAVVPSYREDHSDNTHFWMFVIAFICLLVPRYVSLSSPRPFRAVQPTG